MNSIELLVFLFMPNTNIEDTILFSLSVLFIHYEPLWSSSGGFGEDYPRSGIDCWH